MTDHRTHAEHAHVHEAGCGHAAVTHADHTDYLHDGHLHYARDGHVDEHVLDISAATPADCTPDHTCAEHADGHVHGAECAHPAVPHADHTDYLVGLHLHHPHAGHCDDHGLVAA